MNAFLERTGWTEPKIVAADASARKYSRVHRGDKTAILMEGASAQDFEQFIKITKWLRSCDLSAPAIIETDEPAGQMIIEDFGDTSFKKAIEQGVNEFELYAMASDVLAYLTHKNCTLDLPNYYDSYVHKARGRVIDWFLPAVTKTKNADGLIEEYYQVWEDIEYQFPHPQMGFVHIDYHIENLMFLPDRQDLRRCGILDFQTAMYGPVLYDLANLLEDARREVPQEIKSQILASLDELELGWFRILATQFHCRVIGQFVKIAVQTGNTAYLAHIPRLQKYLHEALEDPLLRPLKRFFAEQKLDFSAHYDLNIPEIARLIREDAY